MSKKEVLFDEKLGNLKSTVDFNYEMQKKRNKVYEEFERLVAACDFEAAKKELDKLDLPEYQYMDMEDEEIQDCSVDSDQESTKQSVEKAADLEAADQQMINDLCWYVQQYFKSLNDVRSPFPWISRVALNSIDCDLKEIWRITQNAGKYA